jgi:hypothetical protein
MNGWPQLRAQRGVLKTVDQAAGMLLELTFVERSDIADRAIGPLLAIRQWDYADQRYTTLRAEDITSRPRATLAPILSGLRPEAPLLLPEDADMAFSRFAGGREIGTVDNTSHYRSGSTDSWRAELPEPVLQYVRAHFYDFLKMFYPEALVN